MKLKKKKFDLLATVGLAVFIFFHKFDYYDVGEFDWNHSSIYMVYIIIALALRKYFYTDK